MLILHDLYKKFGQLVAVDNFSLAVGRGETVVLMGPSGCGKSTTVRMINRLVEPDSGNVIIDGQDITQLSRTELSLARKRIGYVFQHFNLIARLTACENIMLGLVMSGMAKEIAYDKACTALRKVGLETHSEHRPGEMSGGQQQRVGIARALAFEPELMLWDEPTASLDPILVREVLIVMEELARYQESTMIVVTHELSFALHVADRIILMDKGRIVETGKPADVFMNPVSDIGQKYKELIEYQLNIGCNSVGYTAKKN